VRVLEDAVETELLPRNDRGEAQLFAPGRFRRPTAQKQIRPQQWSQIIKVSR
jgi:hypothetical protein